MRSGDAPAADAEGSGAMDLELADGAEAEGEEEESLEAKNARVEELCKPADPEMPENKTCGDCVFVIATLCCSCLHGT